MRQSFKSLADGDDGMSLIGATSSMWDKVEICRMKCVTMNVSFWQSLPQATEVLSGDRTPAEIWNYVLVFVLTAQSW